MNPKFEAASHEREDGATYVKIAGVIDEDHDLASLVPRLHTALRLAVDLSEVEQVNAAGSEALHHWLQQISAGGISVELDRVSPAVVKRLNENPAFTGHATVRSFFAPYFCGKCETEQTHLLRPEDVASGKAPGQVCTECGGTAEFDDEPDYFRFLRQSGTRPTVG